VLLRPNPQVPAFCFAFFAISFASLAVKTLKTAKIAKPDASFRKEEEADPLLMRFSEGQQFDIAALPESGYPA